jgi:hypothetical protein
MTPLRQGGMTEATEGAREGERMNELLGQVQAAVGDAYRLEREMAGGGMSRLFLATERSLNRRVVIKLLPPELTSEVSAARFQQEMELTANLQHPHILSVLGAGARDGLLYYIMPYLEGESLRGRMVREGPLPVADSVRLLSEIADALSFAHARGIIHRDIKPENILLEGKHAVLADFGIARALAQSRTGHSLTGSGTAIGTPGYMAPEQVAGGSVDARADLYSLAVVGYEMLTGAPPFKAPTAQALLAAHLTTPPLPPHELRNEVPEAVSAVIATALSKDPEDRFASAADFADALSRAGSSQAGSGMGRLGSRQSRRMLGRLAIGLLIIAAVTVVVQTARSRAITRALAEDLTLILQSGELRADEKLDSVATLMSAAGASLDRGGMRVIRERAAAVLRITTVPAGAAVSIVRVGPLATFAEHEPIMLGTTPVRTAAIVGGEYLLRIVAPHDDTVLTLVTVPVPDSALSSGLVPTGDSLLVQASLLPAGALQGYVVVPEGIAPDSTPVAAFLISRREVTNSEFARFIEQGGYRDTTLWPASMQVEGRLVPRAVALANFIDRTGLTGPLDWSGGRPPPDRELYPVTGVNLYEASAYARWSGGRLPTFPEWYRAALGDGSAPWPWGRDGFAVDQRANFGLRGTMPVGAHPLGVSPFGAEDMAGNVREWVADSTGSLVRGLAVGGSWRDPSYMFFERTSSAGLPPHAAGDNIGFRVVRDLPPGEPSSGRN